MFFGAVGDGVELVGGEVELRAAQQQVGEQHDADEQQADECEASRHRDVDFLNMLSDLFRLARVEHHGAREQEEDGDQREIQQVAQVEHALDDVLEVREERQRGDAVDAASCGAQLLDRTVGDQRDSRPAAAGSRPAPRCRKAIDLVAA